VGRERRFMVDPFIVGGQVHALRHDASVSFDRG
jgi:hypothetical protein